LPDPAGPSTHWTRSPDEQIARTIGAWVPTERRLPGDRRLHPCGIDHPGPSAEAGPDAVDDLSLELEHLGGSERRPRGRGDHTTVAPADHRA